MLVRANLAGRRLRAPKRADFDFDLVPVERTAIISSSSGIETVSGDANVIRSTDAVTENYFDVGLVRIAGPVEMHNSVYLTATNGAVDGNRVSRLADGACTIFARSAWRTKRYDVEFARVGGQVADELVSYLDGSLAKHVSDTMNARMAGKAIGDTLVYSVQNHSAAQYVRNPSCWLYGAELTCASPWNAESSIFWAGTAITPRHMVIATHAIQSVGNSVRFITNDNQVVTRTITNEYTVPQAVFFDRDCTICLLDSDLPASITPAKLMPADFTKYLPTIESFPLIAVAFDYEERALAKNLIRIEAAGGADGNAFYVVLEDCEDAPASGLTQSIVGGDSGNPIFLIVNGDAVLLTCLSAGGGGQGTAYHTFLDEINAGLTALGGGYQVQTVDLSGFTYYG